MTSLVLLHSFVEIPCYPSVENSVLLIRENIYEELSHVISIINIVICRVGWQALNNFIIQQR